LHKLKNKLGGKNEMSWKSSIEISDTF
jgi:hypothetical protein